MDAEKHNSGVRNSRVAWTTEELRFVEQHYGSLPVKAIAASLGRTASAVKSMARRLGCNGTHRYWTDAEKEVLLTHYSAGVEMKTVMAMLPGRTWSSIMGMVDMLGIVRRRWRQEEYRILKKYYASEGVGVAARLPGRTADAIRNKANTMNLRYCRERRRWTQAELSLLAQNQHLPLAELMLLFADRSRQAVCHARMKLKKSS